MKKVMNLLLLNFIVVLSCIVIYRFYRIATTEIINTDNYTDYFQSGESENGGLELITDSFTRFTKSYNFSIEDKEEKKEVIEKKYEVIKYKVVSGDSLDKIANKNNISLDTLKINNQKVLKETLKKGQTLIIPSENGYIYTIERGDSLVKIAKKYGIKISDITAYNDVDPKKLRPGEKLFLKDVDLKKYNALKEKESVSKATVKTTKSKKTSQTAVSEKKSSSSFAMPVRYQGVNSPFGPRFHPVLKRYILHTGVDLRAKFVPLRAARDGVVSFAGYMNGYGKIIIIKHSDNFETRYAHLSVISTKVGERVKKGDLIGKTGNSGRVTGPHLHFEIRKNGVPKNPMRYL